MHDSAVLPYQLGAAEMPLHGIGSYLIAAKKRIGKIGNSIANPMIIAIFALSLQHLWELLNESWKVVIVTPEVGEGVEKIFLIIAAVSVIMAAKRLMAFTSPAMKA